MQQLFYFINILYKSSVFTSKKPATFKLIPYTLIYIEKGHKTDKFKLFKKNSVKYTV